MGIAYKLPEIGTKWVSSSRIALFLRMVSAILFHVSKLSKLRFQASAIGVIATEECTLGSCNICNVRLFLSKFIIVHEGYESYDMKAY